MERWKLKRRPFLDAEILRYNQERVELLLGNIHLTLHNRGHEAKSPSPISMQILNLNKRRKAPIF